MDKMDKGRDRCPEFAGRVKDEDGLARGLICLEEEARHVVFAVAPALTRIGAKRVVNTAVRLSSTVTIGRISPSIARIVRKCVQSLVQPQAVTAQSITRFIGTIFPTIVSHAENRNTKHVRILAVVIKFATWFGGTAFQITAKVAAARNTNLAVIRVVLTKSGISPGGTIFQTIVRSVTECRDDEEPTRFVEGLT